uniref:NWD1/2-like winged helix-turn-helix domain-containing protein n=1 Tax=Anopheles coluzzii TaxID=1518534 RepID=A0A8W7PUU0_ANOCL
MLNFFIIARKNLDKRLAQKPRTSTAEEAIPSQPVDIVSKIKPNEDAEKICGYFKEERRLLLEIIGPDLQALYDDRQLEIEIVDIHFGTGSDGLTIVDLDPYVLDDHLEEIETCHCVSKSVFLIVLLGSRLGNFLLPTKLDSSIFTAISKLSTDDEVQCLRKWYSTTCPKTNIHQTEDTQHGEGCYWLATNYRTLDRAEWVTEAQQLRELLERKIDEVLRAAEAKETSAGDGLDGEQFCDNLKRLKTRAIAREIEKGLACSSGRILTLFRHWKNQPENDSTELEEDGHLGSNTGTEVKQVETNLIEALPASNHQTLTVDWAENGIDPEHECHDLYLTSFKNKMFEMMKASIDQDLAKDPNGGKGRKKTVQEIFHEHSTHLMYLNEHLSANKYISSKVPERIKQNVQMNFRSGSRHPPYFIHGGHGSGKSTLLSRIYTELTGWFEHTKVHRVIRYASATPRSAYNLELLRVICQQLAIILNIPEGYLPKDASFDPLYINNWFQNLLKHCEDLHNEILFLFIDDLHRLNPLDCDIVAALSWLPISLPWNVFLVVSTTVPIESLRLTPMQKERFKCADYFFDLSLEQNETKIKHWGVVPACTEAPPDELPTFAQLVNGLFDAMEQQFGVKGFSRLAIYITCSEYGLTETELLELLMPTQDADLVIKSNEGDFNFSTFRTIRNQMKLILREKLMSGKLLIVWRHSICAEITRVRYMTPDITRSIHSELVNLFFPPDGDDSEDMSTEQHSRKSSMQTQQDDNVTQVLNLGPDISYSIRHVEEAWHHLIKSEDTKKLKEIAVCNFDFLLAAVSHSGPITYMKVLSQYLVTASEDTSVIVWDMKTLAMKLRLRHDATVCLWSLENFTLLNCIQMSQPILNMQISCDSTFLLAHCADNGLYLRSLTTGTELHALKGHKSKVRALCIAMDSQRAIVGGEDTRALIFDMHSGRVIRSLPPNPGAVTAVYVMEKDDYLITAGGNKITFYSFRNEDSIVNFYPKKKKTLKKFHRNRLALQSTSSPVICFDVSRDSTMAAVASSRCVQIWQLNSPELTSILEGHSATVTCLHVQFTRFDISLECSRIVVQLVDNSCLPIICLHNSPASYIKLPTYSAPARDVEDLRPAGPKRPARRLLKKEVSLDTYTWQKKYAHLTSSVMMAQVDERLKRRFSVSASMEEISKLAEAKNVESQATLGPEQAALAQSQHFDQLEALWNKRSPPRRRLNASLSRQSSLVEDRIDSSDEDEFQEERAVDAWNCSSLYSSTSSTNTQYNQPNHHQQHHYYQHHHRHQPDLLREVLLLKKQHSVPTGGTSGYSGDPFGDVLAD